jgi:hypothetical protein
VIVLALKACSECEEKVSTEAHECPHCGVSLDESSTSGGEQPSGQGEESSEDTANSDTANQGQGEGTKLIKGCLGFLTGIFVTTGIIALVVQTFNIEAPPGWTGCGSPVVALAGILGAFVAIRRM